MIDIQFVRNNYDVTVQKLKMRNKAFDVSLLDRALKLDDERREVRKKLEELRHHQKVVNKEIAQLKKQAEDEHERWMSLTTWQKIKTFLSFHMTKTLKKLNFNSTA